MFNSIEFNNAVSVWSSRYPLLPNTNSEFEIELRRKANKIIDLMVNASNEFEKKCHWNIEHLGQRLIIELKNDKLDIEILFVICYRFLIELDVSTSGDLKNEYTDTIDFGLSNIDKFDEEIQRQIRFAHYRMPLQILKSVFSTDEMKSLKDFPEHASLLNKKIEDWDKSINEKEMKVSELKTSLEQYKYGFNFVGLYAGFDSLESDYKSQKRTLFKSLLALGSAIIIFLMLDVFLIWLDVFDISKDFHKLIFVSVPILSIIFYLTYYFRILLSQHYKLKTQIAQIELRKTLCRFIQSYAEYSTEITKDNPRALEKFEQIIFSNIMENTEQIPNTYDGIEQILELIKGAKKIGS